MFSQVKTAKRGPASALLPDADAKGVYVKANTDRRGGPRDPTLTSPNAGGRLPSLSTYVATTLARGEILCSEACGKDRVDMTDVLINAKTT